MLSYSIHSLVPFLHATADDMPVKTKTAKVLHYIEACFQVLKATNGPVAKVIDSNVQIHGLSYIPDTFQGEAEMVLDHLPKTSRVNFQMRIQRGGQGVRPPPLENHKFYGLSIGNKQLDPPPWKKLPPPPW